MDHQGHHAHHIEEFKKRFRISLLLTIPILLLSEAIQEWFRFVLEMPLQKEVLFLLSALIYFYGGWPFLTGAVDEVKRRQPGMMTLIGFAISVAFIYSVATVFLIRGMDFFWELATLIDVMLLGHWVEAKSVMGASRSLEELVRIMPTTAHLVKGEEVVDVPVSELREGDIVLVRPGEKIPSDGLVVEGSSSVNEALLTGESRLVPKEKQGKVIGASINGEGSLKVEIGKTGEETYLMQVISLVRRAQESRSRTQDLADRAAALLFYVALSAGVVTYVVWFILLDPGFALERAVTVLVIACPHALGLAIPLVVALSTSITAKSGILIRDRQAFERVREVDAIVFDKTGTLTEGVMGVTDVVSLILEEELLSLTAGVELNSEHMLAKAIVEYVREKGIDIPKVEGFTAMPGMGAHAKVNGRRVYVGGSRLIEEQKLEVDLEEVRRLQEQGKTVVYVTVDGVLGGAFALSDRIRKESYAAVRSLKDSGVKVYMLTGDSREVAENVSKELGIDDYFAEVLPDKKAEKIRSLKEKGFRVAMVGDGINDAPALVTADVGIAIGAGTDVAIESADLILVRNNPGDVSRVMELARKTYSKMVQNLWWAAGYNIVMIPLAAGVLYGYGVVVNPAVGAILMSLSTVIVAVNAQTLRKYEPKGEAYAPEKTYRDPVCGMEVSADTSYKTEHRGKTVYFCSEHCKRAFEKNPGKHS